MDTVGAPSSLTTASLAPALAAAGLDGDALGRVDVVPVTGSTSSDLVAAVRAEPGAWPDRSLLVADHQAAGRGRAGRTWETPPGTALTFSVLLRPDVPTTALGWVPLLAGLAAARGVGAVTGERAVVKWPNDVLVADPGAEPLPGWGRHRKLAGVLADLVDPGPVPVVVVGIGINVGQSRAELPVPSATSLRLLGHVVPRERLLGSVLGALLELDRDWRTARGDAGAAGLADACAASSATLGREVAVDLPGGEVLHGTAVALADDGALQVRTGEGAVTVRAGDVRHVRLAEVGA